MMVTLMVMGLLFSCKKSSTPIPKDYTVLIKDKTWWGQLTYTGQTAEYYCIQFNANGSLTWSQLLGDYPGQWVINGKRLTMIISVNGLQIEADISDDNKLLNITDNINSLNVNSGELTANPNVILDNTAWTGTYFNGSSQQPLQINFKPNSKVDMKFGAFAVTTYTYTRSSLGAVIRHSVGENYPFFAVLTSGNLMKGSEQDSRFPLQAIKQ